MDVISHEVEIIMPGASKKKTTISDVHASLVHKGLRTFILDFNNRGVPVNNSPPIMCGVKVLIVFHILQDVTKCDRKNSYSYAQENLLYEEQKNKVVTKLPIIHITLIDLLSEEGSDIEKKIQQLCPRYVSIVDSSSWNYYAPVKIDKSTNNFNFERLEIVLNKIINNYNIEGKGSIYDLAIPNEYADLNARLVTQSYLEGKGHGDNVSPFLFHSEWKMRERSNSLLKERLKEYVGNYKLKWRVLFLDDHCSDEMTLFNESKCTTIKKIDILNTRLREITELFGIKSTNDIFEIHAVKSIKEAETLLKERKFDIVILDYLLGDNNAGREYGYQLLNNIKEGKDEYKDILKNKGPFGKYWFIFSSGFIQAVGERLLTEGISYSEKNWYIGRTSCPVNTPELFVYNFLSLMHRQLETIGITHLDKSDDGRVATTLVDLLFYIFEDHGSTRHRAIKHFNDLLRLRAHYHTLKGDYYMGGKEDAEAEVNGSLLVQSLFPDMQYYSNAFWEHVQHLIYLVAYGNIRQWSEMWDEYIFIRENLIKADKSKEQVHLKIEAYIISLKTANYK